MRMFYNLACLTYSFEIMLCKSVCVSYAREERERQVHVHTREKKTRQARLRVQK
jgi:hypothetical protein